MVDGVNPMDYLNPLLYTQWMVQTQWCEPDGWCNPMVTGQWSKPNMVNCVNPMVNGEAWAMPAPG